MLGSSIGDGMMQVLAVAQFEETVQKGCGLYSTDTVALGLIM